MLIVLVVVLVLSTADAGFAQAPPPPSARQLFDQSCTACHGNPEVSRAADPAVLRRMTPERIYEALTTGVMRVQAQDLSDAARRGIAEYLGDRKLGAGTSGDAKLMPNRCETNPAVLDLSRAPAWNGWGVDLANTRFQPAGAAGLSAAEVPKLRLKWAFGFPGASAVYGQPTLAGGRVFVGADTGYVYALEQVSGCVHWSFQAQAGVRSAVTVGPVVGTARVAAYFGDMKGNVYAVDAASGEPIWKVERRGPRAHAHHRCTCAVRESSLRLRRVFRGRGRDECPLSMLHVSRQRRRSEHRYGSSDLEDVHDSRRSETDADDERGYSAVRAVRRRRLGRPDDRSAAQCALRRHR